MAHPGFVGHQDGGGQPLVLKVPSCYPEENPAAGIAGDFDKTYLPAPLTRVVAAGRPLMKGEVREEESFVAVAAERPALPTVPERASSAVTPPQWKSGSRVGRPAPTAERAAGASKGRAFTDRCLWD